ncbi:unnamed protein product [Phytophthora fragariaefolia]|uniref:Unnamed protein product n=1 Tax=Phytophthora fragariaefolia TaxID=1490495 RepID=A0A9W6XKR7_9STRA|nr:unnamed protein product [Phytophthora fragariaefolia]
MLLKIEISAAVATVTRTITTTLKYPLQSVQVDCVEYFPVETGIQAGSSGLIITLAEEAEVDGREGRRGLVELPNSDSNRSRHDTSRNVSPSVAEAAVVASETVPEDYDALVAADGADAAGFDDFDDTVENTMSVSHVESASLMKDLATVGATKMKKR